jgi:hypothetical protein
LIQLIGLLLCVYLAFKGLEIFQIAHSSKDAPSSAIVIGVCALIAGCVLAGIFALFFLGAGMSMPELPR